MATLTRGHRKGGMVAHLLRTSDAPSVCGRLMAYVPGGEGLRLCRTCAKITGVQLDIDTQAFPEIPELSTLPALAPEWAAMEREWMRNADSFTMGNARDVLTQYMDNPSEYNMSDAGTVRLLAKYRAYIKLHTGADFLDPKDTVTPSTQRTHGDGMVNRNSKSVAKTSGVMTDNQFNALVKMGAWIEDMQTEIAALKGEEFTPIGRAEFITENREDFTRKEIKALFDNMSPKIDALKTELYALRNAKRTEERKTEAKSNPAEDGYYVHGDTFVCVKWNRAGTGQYATVWDGSSWEYDSRESRKLVADVKAGKLNMMTPEDAKRFGDLYGTCFKCSRTLTDPVSIAQGYGPVCAGRMGW